MIFKNRSGCIKTVLIIAILITIGFSIFYMVVWRVPDNSETFRKEFERLVKSKDQDNKLSINQNGWFDYEKAINKTQVTFQDFPKMDLQTILTRGVTEEDRDYVVKLKNSNREVLEYAGKGFEKEKIRIPIKFRDGANARVPNFLAMKDFSQMMSVLAESAQMEGKYMEASEYLLSGIRLGANTGHNGVLISGMIGITLIRYDLPVLNKLLRDQSIDVETCRYVTKEMTRINGEFFTFEELLDGEMAMVEFTLLDAEKKGPKDIIKFMNGNTASGFPSQSIVELIPAGPYIDRERKIYINWYLKHLEILRKGYPALKNSFPQYKFPPLSIIEGVFVPNMNRAYKQFTFARASMRGIEILAALEWYRRENGEYPDSLSRLVPDCLPKLPEDPYSRDRKFIYRKDGNKVYFYSRGEDLQDDNAKTRMESIEQNGDIVFLAPEKNGKE